MSAAELVAETRRKMSGHGMPRLSIDEMVQSSSMWRERLHMHSSRSTITKVHLATLTALCHTTLKTLKTPDNPDNPKPEPSTNSY